MLAGPMKGRGRDAPVTGSQALAFNLHQTFSTPDGLIPLGLSLVAKLIVFENWPGGLSKPLPGGY
jgi:hypothetical protein